MEAAVGRRVLGEVEEASLDEVRMLFVQSFNLSSALSFGALFHVFGGGGL